MRCAVAAVLLGIAIILSSCGSGPEVNLRSAEGGPFSIELGSLEGTYLKLLWSHTNTKPIDGLYYDQGVLLVSARDRTLSRIDLGSGLPGDRVLRLKGKIAHPPVVYRGVAEKDQEATTEVYVVQDGDVLWAIDADALMEMWAEKLGFGVACAPCVSESAIFVAAEGGQLDAIAKKDRQILWTFKAGKTISAPPVLPIEARGAQGTQGGAGVAGASTDADFMYAASQDGTVYRLNLNVGWKPPGERGGYSWSGVTRARIMTSPVTYQQRVYVASFDYTMYAFEGVDGALAWKYHVGRFVREQPFAYQGRLFVIAEEFEGGPRTMYAINTRNGACAWKRTLAGAGGQKYQEDGLPGVAKFLAPGREVVYVLAQEKPEIWAVRIADGVVLHRIALTEHPDFVVSHDAAQGRNADEYGLIILGTKAGRIIAMKERRVYAEEPGAAPPVAPEKAAEEAKPEKAAEEAKPEKAAEEEKPADEGGAEK